jgi:hypothetical protein
VIFLIFVVASIALFRIMNFAHAVQRLRNHANAPGSGLPERESFLFVLWQAEREARAPELRSLFDDILSCFEAINHALNMPDPSGTISGKAEALPRSLVADVSVILSNGWSNYWRWQSDQKFSNSFRTEFAIILVQVGIAWDAVLAGDIDEIREEVQTEFLARNNQQI